MAVGIQPLYDDHQTSSAHGDDATATATATTTGGTVDGGGSGSTSDGAEPAAGQPAGLTDSTQVGEMNPIEAFVGASNYSREDLQLAISVLSLVLWVATTYYAVKEM